MWGSYDRPPRGPYRRGRIAATMKKNTPLRCPDESLGTRARQFSQTFPRAAYPPTPLTSIHAAAAADRLGDLPQQSPHMFKQAAAVSALSDVLQLTVASSQFASLSTTTGGHLP